MSFPDAPEKTQMHGLFRILMRDGFDHFSHFHLDAQFLHQLALQRLLEGFRLLSLAAGELPQSGEMSASRTLGDEESSVAEDKGSGNFDGLHEVPERFPLLPPDTLVDEAQLLHFLRVEQIAAVEQYGMTEELAGAFEIELFEFRPFGGNH